MARFLFAVILLLSVGGMVGYLLPMP